MAVCADKRLQVVGCGEAREAKAHIWLEQIAGRGWDMNQEGSRYVLKTAGTLCSVLFHKERRAQGLRNHWVDTTTCLIHFITEKKKTPPLERDKMLRESLLSFFFFFFKHNVFVLMIQLVLKHYVDVLLSVAQDCQPI